MSLSHYRRLYRRITCLPLDAYSLQSLRLKIRTRFKQKSLISTRFILDRAKYDHALSVCDEILLKNKLLSLGSLLDLVHKCDEKEPLWVSQFKNTKYNAFSSVWPQIHLINEIGNDNHIRSYYRELKKLESNSGFPLMKYLSIEDDPKFPTLSPIRHDFQVNKLSQSLHDNMREFFIFLRRHSARALSGAKLHDFEVFYHPNSYGYPLSVESRQIILRKKINYMKSLLRTYVPISEKSLQSLILFIHNDNEAINPNYYRYMIRKRKKEIETSSVSYLEMKYVREKELVADDRLLKFHYRMYLTSQFSRQANGTYKMSPLDSVFG